MKVINTGIKFDLYPDDLRSYDKLPAGNYIVRFDIKNGFYLEKYSDFQMMEPKVYGIHTEKVNKVLNSFDKFNRNLGVILSGDKGIGKSLFARLLGIKAVAQGIPVIIVEGYVDGIASYLDSIDQEVMILFDEFDKTFSHDELGGMDPQTSMLTLFDGVAQGKKLFVVTCNDLYRLNGFLVNRPGRFHYHFRFEYPTAQDIEEYLKDKLEGDNQNEIKRVVDFSRRIALNYDCLRAIAFELNMGLTFSEAVKDLNIVNMDRERYQIVFCFEDGTRLSKKEVYMDSFGAEQIFINLVDYTDSYAGEATFSAENIEFNLQTGELCVRPETIKLDYDNYDLSEEENQEKKQQLLAKNLVKVVVQRVQAKKLHYSV